MAYQYCSFGAHVAILSRRKEKLEKVALKCKGLGAASVTVVAGDVSTSKESNEYSKKLLIRKALLVN